MKTKKLRMGLVTFWLLSPLTFLDSSQPALSVGCNYGLNDQLKPYGDIGASWQALGGVNSPLGCPLTSEANAPDGPGRIQTFQFGQISWSAPKAGSHPILIAYQAGNAIEVIWAGTQPFNYDFWIVRTDSSGVNISQEDVGTRRTDGWYVWRNAIPGQNYSFIVEGCNERGIGSVIGKGPKCRQGWMNRVAVNMQPNPIQGTPTLPNPPGRNKSCFVAPLQCPGVETAINIVAKVAAAIK